MTQTVIDILRSTAREHGGRPALRAKRNGVWQTISWAEYFERVMAVARGLIRLGLEAGQGVAIMGFNRPEWFFSQVGAMAAGGVPTGIYTTSTPEQCAYIADHAGAVVAVVENDDYLRKFLEIRPRLPRLAAIVRMEGEGGGTGVYSWSQLLELGASVRREEVEARLRDLQADEVCSLIYTSGTTGPPKAVMLSHHNVVWTARRAAEGFHITADSSFISYLPLSHIAEQMVSLYVPMTSGACSWFAESLEKLGENLREVRPTFFFGVPRVWEKIQAGIEVTGAQSPALKRRIAAWARRRGLEGGYAEQRGEPKPRFYAVADRLVFRKVRRRLGLDRARICGTSAAPISLNTLEFFLSLGIPILEVYGMSECTGPTTLSYPNRYRTGKAGLPIPGTELQIAEDGEIMMRGPHVFLGYYKNEAATRETLDAEGWIHSGDVGELDAEGFLRVTDRKKELIITSGGKNIAPQVLEGKLKDIPAVGQAVVVGDGRKYVAALLTLDPEKAMRAARMAGSSAGSVEEAAVCRIFREHLERQVEAVNDTLASFETIKRFEIIPGELSVNGGELTPTMKLKRRVIWEKYADAIERLYE